MSDLRRQLEEQLRQEDKRDRRRLVLRLVGWALLGAALIALRVLLS